MKQVLGLGLLSLMACATAQPKLAGNTGTAGPGLLRASAGGTSELRVGQLLEIELPGNPSTGYQWQLVNDGAPVVERIMPAAAAAAAKANTPADPAMVGAPNSSRWWFKAVQPGEAVLRLVYRRPWEKDAPPARTADYPLSVQ
jgi:inhibitor of cysteine peptidase